MKVFDEGRIIVVLGLVVIAGLIFINCDHPKGSDPQDSDASVSDGSQDLDAIVPDGAQESDTSYIDGATNIYLAPWVTMTTTDSTTINWRGNSSQSGTVDYATSSYYAQNQGFNNTATTASADWYQHVQLTGLEADTAYTYQVKPASDENAFAVRTFQTLPVSGPFTFIVISDSQEGLTYEEKMRFKYVAEAIAKEPEALFVLHGGDYARIDVIAKWETFFEVADPMLAKLTLYPAIGNHEYHCYDADGSTPTAAIDFHYAFAVPLNYSFDCAGVRFIILNTPDPNAAIGRDPQTSVALAQSQASWLEQQLNSNMSGIFTIHHHPIWDDSRLTLNSDLQSWETLYHTYQISANFAGHIHNYQSYLIEGIPYFIVGTAGGPASDLAGINPPVYRWSESKRLGYLRVKVDPENNTATAEQVCVATVLVDDSNETPTVLDPPVIDDTITFDLK